MFKTKSIYHLIVYSLFFVILFISVFTFIIVDNTSKELQYKVKIQKQNYIKTQQELLKRDIERIISFIDYYNNKYKNTKDEKTIKKEILESLVFITKSKNLNEYIFIYDTQGKLLFHPITPNKIGENRINYQDSSGKYVIQELIKVSKSKDGGFVDYFWDKPNIKKDVKKMSYVKSYKKWNWIISKGVYLDEINKLLEEKQKNFDEKIFNYSLLIITLTILLLFYSIFIYTNAKAFILGDVEKIEKYFKKSQEENILMNYKDLKFAEFKKIANYASDAITNIKIKTHMLEDLNKNLENKVEEKTKELSKLIESQKNFIKKSVHEINTPLAIIRTSVDLLKMKIPNNKHITNIESGAKTIQYIYDDLSYIVKKDRVEYKKEYLDFSSFLEKRLEFFRDIVISNRLSFKKEITKEIYIKFNHTELQRIIDNNISNAIKYSYQNSFIYIKLDYINDNEIEFIVKTNSKKIKETNKIFDDFYRENDVKGGFGLGLKIVKDICDKNFVIISLNSNDKETIFKYRFKINEDITT